MSDLVKRLRGGSALKRDAHEAALHIERLEWLAKRSYSALTNISETEFELEGELLALHEDLTEALYGNECVGSID